jgi:hypothetical protein
LRCFGCYLLKRRIVIVCDRIHTGRSGRGCEER